MSQYDHKRLDDLIHSRIRLAIMAMLYGAEAVEFSLIKKQVGATDGNLGSHLRKLEDADYIAVDKQFEQRKPVSRYSLTKSGRQAFADYLSQLEALLPESTNKV